MFREFKVNVSLTNSPVQPHGCKRRTEPRVNGEKLRRYISFLTTRFRRELIIAFQTSSQ